MKIERFLSLHDGELCMSSAIWLPRHELQLLGIAQKGEIQRIDVVRATHFGWQAEAQPHLKTHFIEAGAWHTTGRTEHHVRYGLHQESLQNHALRLHPNLSPGVVPGVDVWQGSA